MRGAEDVQLPELIAVVSDAVQERRIGRLVHVRMHVIEPMSTDRLPARAEEVAESLQPLFPSPRVSASCQKSKAPSHRTLLVKFRDGESMLLSCTAAPESESPRYDLLAIGTQGTVRYEGL